MDVFSCLMSSRAVCWGVAGGFGGARASAKQKDEAQAMLSAVTIGRTRGFLMVRRQDECQWVQKRFLTDQSIEVSSSISVLIRSRPERAMKSRKAWRTLKHIRLVFLVYLVFTILQRLMAKASSKEANFRAFPNGGPAHRASLEVAACLSHGMISESSFQARANV
jgi:hypothetical protein